MHRDSFKGWNKDLGAYWGQDRNCNKYSLWFVCLKQILVFFMYIYVNILPCLLLISAACKLINNNMKQFVISSETDAIREVEDKVSSFLGLVVSINVKYVIMLTFVFLFF